MATSDRLKLERIPFINRSEWGGMAQGGFR